MIQNIFSSHLNSPHIEDFRNIMCWAFGFFFMTRKLKQLWNLKTVTISELLRFGYFILLLIRSTRQQYSITDLYFALTSTYLILFVFLAFSFFSDLSCIFPLSVGFAWFVVIIPFWALWLLLMLCFMIRFGFLQSLIFVQCVLFIYLLFFGVFAESLLFMCPPVVLFVLLRLVLFLKKNFWFASIPIHLIISPDAIEQ